VCVCVEARASQTMVAAKRCEVAIQFFNLSS
jgi:hypothetical protein